MTCNPEVREMSENRSYRQPAAPIRVFSAAMDEYHAGQGVSGYKPYRSSCPSHGPAAATNIRFGRATGVPRARCCLVPSTWTARRKYRSNAYVSVGKISCSFRGRGKDPGEETMVRSLEQSTMRKVYLRLLPFAFLSIAGLHRSDQRQLRRAHHAHRSRNVRAEFGFAVGSFYWGYFLFEVPSNIIMARSARGYGSRGS